MQVLDGVGAGIFGALFPLVVADLTRGTGHFNISQGAIATAAGLGGALSTAAAGFIVVKAGCSAAFLFLAAVAGAGLIGFATMMPETLRHSQDEPGGLSDKASGDFRNASNSTLGAEFAESVRRVIAAPAN